jgi:hypothetical protein
MRFCAFAPIFVAAWIAKPGYGFTFPRCEVGTRRNLDTCLSLEPHVFSEYMVKAHEAKLKALKGVEEQKETEIQV